MENLLQLDSRKIKSLLDSKIFTAIQLGIIKKRILHKSLNQNEQKYYYKFIKPKILAMLELFEVNNNISGREFIIPDRISQAIKILDKIKHKHKNNKIIISGSFLFNKEYNDIDIFVFSKYTKQDYRMGKLHVNFLKEEALNSMFFRSMSSISISNFKYEISDDFNIEMIDVIQKYELLVNDFLEGKKDIRILREFILSSEYIRSGIILNPKELHNLSNKFIRKNTGFLSHNFINTLISNYNMKDIRKILTNRIKDYENLRKKYVNSKNLQIYIDTYSKVNQIES